MKKCYTILLCFISALTATSQTARYWVGPSSGAGGTWNNTANWSATSGGAGGASVPNDATYNVIFNQGAVVQVDLSGTVQLNSIKVTNNTTAVLYTANNLTFNLASTSAATPGLDIDAGSKLRDSIIAGVTFNVTFAANGKAEVDGDFRLGTDPAVSSGAPVVTTTTSGVTFNVNSGGRLILGARAAASGSTSTLQFNAGSFMVIDRDAGSSPIAFYNPSSTIQIVGNVTLGSSIGGVNQSVGNVEYNSANLNPGANLPTMALQNNTTIQGNFRILNTNNKKITLLSNTNPGSPSALNITVQGNFEVSPNSVVSISSPVSDLPNRDSLIMTVNGNYIQTGGTVSLQDYDPITPLTKLVIKGNIVQTGGNLTVGSNTINNTRNLFIVELAGSSNQNISFSSGTIDNSNTQVALRMNNPAGATLLTPLSVGRMHFITGVLTTAAATPLTINNTSNDPFVTSGVSDASFVAGPVKRRTNLAAAYIFPTGKGNNYRIIEVIPSTTTSSEYTAEYFNSNHPDPDVAAPLTGRSTVEYWTVTRSFGSNAAIRLTLEGGVPGATGLDGLVVARYGGTAWQNAKGTTGTGLPGGSTSGTLTSQVETSFTSYTVGYGPADALPIKIISFTATKGSGYNNVHWQADCSSTQAIFEVERSTDGQNFQKIETIVADQQRCQQPFDYQDKTATAATNFYRLKVTDDGGKTYYSRIVAIISQGKGFELVGVYPSLISSGQLKVNITAASRDKAELYITNISGQVIRRMQVNVNAGENIIYVNVDGLASGAYHVTGRNSEGETKTLRFVKQ